MRIGAADKRKYQGLQEGARAKATYSSMMTKIRDYAPDQYRKYVAAAHFIFRQADAGGANYYKLYIAAPEGAFLKTVNRDMSAHFI